jgi:hypothetical protein
MNEAICWTMRRDDALDFAIARRKTRVAAFVAHPGYGR